MAESEALGWATRGSSRLAGSSEF